MSRVFSQKLLKNGFSYRFEQTFSRCNYYSKINSRRTFFNVKNASKNNSLKLYVFCGCIAVGYYCYWGVEMSPIQVSNAITLFSSKSSPSTDPSSNALTSNTGPTLKSAMEYSERKDKDVEKAYEDLKLFEKEADTNFELCWRLSRACIQYANKVDLDADFTMMLSAKAVDYAKRALAINPWSSVAHLWMGIALSNHNSFESYFNRILNAPIIKGHFERAIEFNPADPLAHHMLAMWHFTVADYSFWAKLVALVAFGGGPVMTSFHEALMKFEDAERIQPNFSIKNHLMLGKTNVRIGNYSAARKWLDHCLKMPTTCSEDSQIKEDAMFIIHYLDQIDTT